jgi:hypothetical protein
VVSDLTARVVAVRHEMQVLRDRVRHKPRQALHEPEVFDGAVTPGRGPRSASGRQLGRGEDQPGS